MACGSWGSHRLRFIIVTLGTLSSIRLLLGRPVELVLGTQQRFETTERR